MTNRQILEKAIQKAIDGGFVYHGFEDDMDLFGKWFFEDSHAIGTYDLVFDHDFAKALWGVKLTNYYELWFKNNYNQDKDGSYYGKAWKWHLMQMVVAENPIEYLGANIDTTESKAEDNNTTKGSK